SFPQVRPDFRRYILENHYVHRPGSLMTPPPTRPPLASLPPELRGLFSRCFLDGHTRPDSRPHAEEWRIALAAASRNLVICRDYRSRHASPPAAGRCPGSALLAGGVDLFAAAPAPALLGAAPATRGRPNPPGRRRPAARWAAGAAAALVLAAALWAGLSLLPR